MTVNGGPLDLALSVDNDSICDNSYAVLKAVASGGSGNYTFSWTPAENLSDRNSGETTFSPDDIVEAFKEYDFSCEVSDGFNTVTKTISVTVFDYLDANAGNDTTIVYNTIAELAAVIPDGVNADNFIFSWTPEEFALNSDMTATETVKMTATQTFTLTVTNKAFDGCSSSDEKTVTVNGGPLELEVSADEYHICENASTQFHAIASGGSGNYSYTWSAINGIDDIYAKDPNFTPEQVYTVCDSIIFICTVNDGYNTASDSLKITIYDFLDANAGNDTAIVYNTIADLMAEYTGYVNTDNFIFHWEPADLVADPDAMITETLPLEATTTFTLTITNRLFDVCTSSDEKVVTVYNQAVANFTANDVCLGETTYFTFTGSIIDDANYHWDFGEGDATSDMMNPYYVYQQAGQFEVFLTVTTDNSTNTISKFVNVYEIPVADFSSDQVCLGNETTLTAVAITGATYLWDFDNDGNIDMNTTDNVVTYSFTSVNNTVALTVISEHGCVSEITEKDVNVYEIPVADFTAEDVCFGEEMIFNATEIDGATYTWNFGYNSDDVVTTEPNITYTYPAANQDEGYVVTLTVTSEYGCEGSQMTKTVKVFETLAADAGDDQMIPYGTKTSIEAIVPQDLDTDNFIFQWEPANLLVDPNALITETKYHMVAPQTFTLTVKNKLNGDCSSSDDVLINIIGDAMVVTDTICDDGVSYPDGLYWLYNENGWGFSFPGHYKGEGDITVDGEGNLMKVKYDITLLNKLEVPEIGLGHNAEIVYHLGLGFDFYVFQIGDIKGGGSDEIIPGFENIPITYEWSVEMIEGSTPWTFDHSTNNTVTVNVKSNGAAYLRCYISSLCGTVERWMILYTPGYRPCLDATDLYVEAIGDTWASLRWQSTAERCEVRYGTDPSCSESIITTAKNIRLENLTPNTQYYWKVKSLCEDGVVDTDFIDGPEFYTHDVDNGLGIDDNSTYEIAMYPNPAYDKVTIEGKDITNIEIYNALSVVVYREKGITNNIISINTSNFSRGLYFVRYTLNDGTNGIMRLVIE